MARRLRSGDVLEVEFPKVPSPEVAWPEGGYGYLLYVGKHHHNGDAVCLRPGILYERPAITEDLFKDSYIVLYPANHAVKLKLATVVGQLAPVPMPTVFRRPGWIAKGGKVESWFVDDENGTTVTESLTDAQRLLPIASFWNHELVLIRMAEEWRPEKAVTNLGQQKLPSTYISNQLPVSPAPPDEEMEISSGAQKDEIALNELAQGSDTTQPHALKHYLYFRTKKAARQVAIELNKQGFEAKEQRSADGKDWLVLASHHVVITGELIAATRQAMEDLVQPFAGQYDGWEVEVG